MPDAGAGERILVIEDDPTIGMGLELNLTAEGFRVSVVRDGGKGLREALGRPPDLLILDLMLPTVDGFEILSRLRQAGCEVPVIILSARGEEQDKLHGFGLGADDYVTKPFSLNELLARVDARLRRVRDKRPVSEELRFGEIRFDLAARRVCRGAEEVLLTGREVALLSYLVEHRGRVHSRERLLGEVWGMDYEGTERTVDNFIRSLRVKLEVDPSHPRHLITVRGAGYRFDP